MGVADLCDACSDWSLTVGLQFDKTFVGDVFFCVGDKYLSATFVGECEQAVIIHLQFDFDSTAVRLLIKGHQGRSDVTHRRPLTRIAGTVTYLTFFNLPRPAATDATA